MKTYWDLSEKERAALTRDDLNRFIDAELMLKGVLKVGDLALEPEPEMPQPKRAYFRVVVGGNTTDIAFETAEQAAAFRALKPLYLRTEYVGSYSNRLSVIDEDRDPSIAEILAFTVNEFAQVRATATAAATVKDANTKKKTEHEKAAKVQADALSGMTTDWYECRDKHSSLERIVATFRDYVKTAGDPTLAARFLGKVFSRDEIAEAAEWFGVEIPIDETVKVAEKPQAESAPEINF